MNKVEATKLVKAQIVKEHPGIKGLKIQWVEFGKGKTPTGMSIDYGVCAVSANGFKIQGFTFTHSAGTWKAYQSRQAMNKIAKML